MGLEKFKLNFDVVTETANAMVTTTPTTTKPTTARRAKTRTSNK